MFLKEIDIQGFKSFADKTKVVFEKGVTAVVGPNGSGKSNITESLRWALGESSVKSLRGGKMPDVIFAGTESRKPLNYASVTVVLDNSDGFISGSGAEIRVERHIYRSGDSEYKIDGKKVRLRDIHDLFLDTGLGRDSFSIISQGKVEEIFNSKPEERRAIFEEAAGVLKYKTRRKETESKLHQTQDNLDRLEDIIFELEGQIKPLEKQARVAKQFLDLDAKRKELHLDVLVAQISDYKVQHDRIEQDLSAVQAELKSYYDKRQRFEAENQELKKQRQTLSQQLEKDQANLLHLTSLVSDLERQLDLHQLEANQAATNRRETKERLASLREKKEQLQAQVHKEQTSLSHLLQELAENRLSIAKVEEDLAHFSDNPDQIIEHLRDQYVNLMQEEADISNEVTALESQLTHQLKLTESKQSDFVKLQEDVTETKVQEERALSDLDQARAQVKELLGDYQRQQAELHQLETKYQTEQERMFGLMDEVKNKEARKNSLESILKNHSQFYAGVKAVLQQKSQLSGIVGAVSEHLTFDTRYQTALEIAMGASAQHIIVEDERAATQAIDFLKANRAGRATFLPLTTIKSRELPVSNLQKIKASKGFLGLASELVRFDPALQTIFQNLLGTIAIFETVEDAKLAARSVQYQVRIVTLDGTELRTGGSYAGGANRTKNTTFIKPELDVLTKELNQQKEQLHQVEQRVQVLKKQLEQAQAALSVIREKGEHARLAEQKAELAYQQVEKHLEELLQLEQLQASDLLGQESLDMTEKKSHLIQRLKDIQIEKESISKEIEQVKSDKDAVQARFERLSQELADLKLQKAEWMSQERFSKSELSRMESDIDGLNREIGQLSSLLENKGESLSKGSLESLEAQLSTAKEDKGHLQQSLIRLKFELEDIEGQAEDITSHLEQARYQNEELIRKQAKVEAEKDRLADYLRRLSGQLIEDYKMSFDEACLQVRELDNLEEAEKEVKTLEKSIRSLGPINVDAIEQFDEVKERLDFLNAQRDDVLSAKNLLLETITEMNDEVKERFKLTFDAIRESFKITFKQMFGGGFADLVLTEGDLLTAGVEISVQPPGKKIQSLNLMSGGEKALSALALLFSIIRVKTIPFVILDEVEAALDEANVKRFGDYLNRFDKDSQFIVVTHRKGTMAAADSIYGVTMQESGVSKIVSVKLKELEQDDSFR